MAYREDAALAAATRSGSGASTALTTFAAQVDATLFVRVASPTSATKKYLDLIVKLQDSPDGTNWYDVASLVIQSVGAYSVKAQRPLSDNVRVSYDFQNDVSATLEATITSR
jgi:prephenate dehydrogenase